MPDDFLTALNYAIKEEIVDNYFNERRIIEEEIKMVEEQTEANRKKVLELEKDMASLLALFPNSQAQAEFWQALDRPAPEEDACLALGIKALPLSKGVFWKRRYRALVRNEAARVGDVWEQFGRDLAQADDLAEEVNRDIDKFHINYDFLLLRSVLAEMDPEMVEKKYFMGCSMDGCSVQELDESLRFKRLPKPSSLLPLVGRHPTKSELIALAEKTAEKMVKEHYEQVFKLLS